MEKCVNGLGQRADGVSDKFVGLSPAQQQLVVNCQTLGDTHLSVQPPSASNKEARRLTLISPPKPSPSLSSGHDVAIVTVSTPPPTTVVTTSRRLSGATIDNIIATTYRVLALSCQTLVFIGVNFVSLEVAKAANEQQATVPEHALMLLGLPLAMHVISRDHSNQYDRIQAAIRRSTLFALSIGCFSLLMIRKADLFGRAVLAAGMIVFTLLQYSSFKRNLYCSVNCCGYRRVYGKPPPLWGHDSFRSDSYRLRNRTRACINYWPCCTRPRKAPSKLVLEL